MDTNLQDPIDTEEQYRVRLVRYMIVGTGHFALFYAVYTYFQGNYFAAVINGFIAVVIGCGYFITGKDIDPLTRRAIFRKLAYLYFATLLILQVDTILRGGIEYVGWVFIAPTLAFFILGKREGGIVVLVFFVVIGTTLTLIAAPHNPYHFLPNMRLQVIVTYAGACLIGFIYESVRNHTLSNLIRQQSLLKESEGRYRKAYDELKQTQRQLIQSSKLASIGELASGVAHELNQPLMVIRGTAQFLKRGIGRKTSTIPDLAGQLDLIERNTKRMMNIIHHLRTFSRQSHQEFSETDVNRVLEDCFLMVNEQLRLQDIHLKRDLSTDLPPVLGSADQLEQVFLNLISNARDAIMEKRNQGTDADRKDGPEGELQVVTRMADGGADGVEVLLRDSGAGIAAEHLDKVFDPFFTTKEVGKGTGLGLSVSYGIIQEHRGIIEILETGPQGTTFRVKLPVTKHGSSGAEGKPEPDRQGG